MSIRVLLGSVVVVGLVLLGAPSAEAATIYDETVSGDLPGDQTAPTPIGTLALGTNTVTGNHTAPDGSSQGDTFEVNLPAGLEFASITLEIQNFVVAPGTQAAATVYRTPPFTVYQQTLFSDNASISFDGVLPLPTPGAYAFSVQYGTLGTANGYDWTWTITTQLPDTTPPTLTCNIRRTFLWPPRLGMFPVGLTASATDERDPNPVIAISVFSNEEDGTFPFAPDAATTTGTPSSLRLRAERAFPGLGRIYLVVVSATDAAGNSTFVCKGVIVPVFPTSGHLLALSTAAAAAEAECEAGVGGPALPAGFEVILP